MDWKTEPLENEILKLKQKIEELEEKNKKLEYKIGEAYVQGYNEGRKEMKKGLESLKETLDKIKNI